MPITQASYYTSNILIRDALGTPLAPGPYFGFQATPPAVNSTGPRLMAGTGDPSGTLTAPIGTLYIDATTGILYRNLAGTTTWASFGAGVPSLLGTVTVGAAGAASAAFSSIPATGYTDLLVTAELRSTTAALTQNVSMFFNGDTTTTNYHQQYAAASNGAAVVTESNAAVALRIPGANSPAAMRGAAVIRIARYGGSQPKTALVDFGAPEDTGSLAGGFNTVQWVLSATAAISSITFTPAADLLAAGSTLRLFGIP